MEIDLDNIDDLDFGDKIKEFLEHKLKEIKSINTSNEEKIKERKDHLNKTLETFSGSRDKLCTVTWNWKKYFNNKFVICYTVCSRNSTLGIVKPLLTWSSTKQLNYKLFIYGKFPYVQCKNETICQRITDDLEQLKIVSSEAFVVAVIDGPTFLENLEYVVNGKLSIRQGETGYLVDLPNVTISSDDYMIREVCEVPLTVGKLENFLVGVSATENTDLVLIFPEDWSVSLDSTFEIHCSLTKIQLHCSCKTYFVANHLSPSFDNTILVLHSTKSRLSEPVCTRVHFSSKNALFLFLHHMHRQIPGLVVIPAGLYKSYKIKFNKTKKLELLQHFQDSVNNEIEAIEALNGLRSKRIERRLKLTHLEKETDVSYLKLLGFVDVNDDC